MLRLFHWTIPSLLLSAGCVSAPASISLTVATRALPGEVYGNGAQGVLLVAHGGYSTNASWAAEAKILASEGFQVLVFETRGAVELAAGKETDCLYDEHCMAEDILTAAKVLRERGATSIAVIAGSAGGGGAAQAAGDAPLMFDRLVLLAPMAVAQPERIGGRKLVAIARGDLGSGDKPRLPEVERQFTQMPQPKVLLILDGSAHGQRIFQTTQADSLRRTIIAFLQAR